MEEGGSLARSDSMATSSAFWDTLLRPHHERLRREEEVPPFCPLPTHPPATITSATITWSCRHSPTGSCRICPPVVRASMYISFAACVIWQ